MQVSLAILLAISLSCSDTIHAFPYTYIMTCRQVGDLFTKVLGPQQFCQLTDKATGYWTRWVNGQPPKRYRYSTITSVQDREDK